MKWTFIRSCIFIFNSYICWCCCWKLFMPCHLNLSFAIAILSAGSGSSWLQNSSFVAGIEYRKRPLYSVFPTKPAQVSSVEDLYEFICSGPLLDKIGITQEQVAESIDNWLLYGRYLCRLFQLNELYLTEPQKARIYHYYVPVFLWCEQQIAEHQSKFKDGEDIPPLVVCYILGFLLS